MKLVVNLGVSDESTLIGPCVNQLLTQGFDEIVVADTGSKDGTLELLKDMQKEGKIHLLCFSEDDERRFDYAQHMLAYSRTRLNADWVTFIDADEFFFFRGRSVKDYLLDPGGNNLLYIPRFNIPLSQQQKTYEITEFGLGSGAETLMISSPIGNFDQYLPEHPETPWIAGAVAPKLFVQPRVAESYLLGGHGVAGDGINKGRIQGLLLLHLPFTTYARFEDKIRRAKVILEKYSDHFDGIKAWHWKRWVSIFEHGRLEEEFKQQFFLDADPQLTQSLQPLSAGDYLSGHA